MSLSKSKCLYSYNCLHFLKRAVRLPFKCNIWRRQFFIHYIDHFWYFVRPFLRSFKLFSSLFVDHFQAFTVDVFDISYRQFLTFSSSLISTFSAYYFRHFVKNISTFLSAIFVDKIRHLTSTFFIGQFSTFRVDHFRRFFVVKIIS